jgi:uncharacterized protein
MIRKSQHKTHTSKNNSHNHTAKSINFTILMLIAITLFTIPLSYSSANMWSSFNTVSTEYNIANIQKQTTLLAVSELENGSFIGGTARLTLEVIPGKGRIFFDTFPLTKIDTQISTRSAKAIACDFLDVECSTIDFIYTIESGSSIIGGPSAGASMTILTIALLDGQELNKNVAITGTINPGGFIGPVGGLKEKIQAAQKQNIKTVLIPLGERYVTQTNQIDVSQIILNNDTIKSGELAAETKLDLVEFGKSIGVTVVEVADIYEALPYIIDKKYPFIESYIETPDYYTQTMQELAQIMCQNSENIKASLNIITTIENTTITITSQNIEIIAPQNQKPTTRLPNSSIDVNATYYQAQAQYESAQLAINQKQYYAAASFCYGSTLNYRFLAEFTKPIKDIQTQATNSIGNWNSLHSYKTITDLQTYMLVEERLEQAKNHLKTANELNEKNLTYAAINQYVTAIERLESAKAWSKFYNGYGAKYNFNTIQASCQIKLQEANERYNYLTLYTTFTGRIKENLDKAKEHANNGNYELCLHQSSIVKAEIDVILSTASITQEQLNQTIQKRIPIVEQAILKQIQKGNFPIIGYSYYEYAVSLAEVDPSSSLLYLQYALELSSLDIYFNSQNENGIRNGTNNYAASGLLTNNHNSNNIFDILAKQKGTEQQLEFLKGMTLGVILAVCVLFASRRLLSAP